MGRLAALKDMGVAASGPFPDPIQREDCKNEALGAKGIDKHGVHGPYQQHPDSWPPKSLIEQMDKSFHRFKNLIPCVRVVVWTKYKKIMAMDHTRSRLLYNLINANARAGLLQL